MQPGGYARRAAQVAGEAEAGGGMESSRVHARNCLHDLHGMDS